MPILYSVIARGSTILAKYAIQPGNFDDVILEILKKKPEERSKNSYQFHTNIINCIADSNVAYICINNADYNNQWSFLFLESIKSKFTTKYGMLVQTALPYAMNSEFGKVMGALMSHFNSKNPDLTELETQIDQLTSVMKSNLDKSVQRSQNIDNLHSQTEILSENSVVFRRAASRVKARYRCRNIKTIVLIVIGVVAILSIVIGLLVWQFKN